jgi:hypothetical protein
MRGSKTCGAGQQEGPHRRRRLDAERTRGIESVPHGRQTEPTRDYKSATPQGGKGRPSARGMSRQPSLLHLARYTSLEFHVGRIT